MQRLGLRTGATTGSLSPCLRLLTSCRLPGAGVSDLPTVLLITSSLRWPRFQGKALRPHLLMEALKVPTKTDGVVCGHIWKTCLTFQFYFSTDLLPFSVWHILAGKLLHRSGAWGGGGSKPRHATTASAQKAPRILIPVSVSAMGFLTTPLQGSPPCSSTGWLLLMLQVSASSQPPQRGPLNRAFQHSPRLRVR